MNRRRTLLSSAYIPVQDGLLLWMDGIKNTRSGHSTTPTVWEDLSGNNIDGAYIGNVIYDENGFIVDKQSGISYVAIDSPLIAVNYQKDFTAEFLFSIERFASGKTNEIFGCLHSPSFDAQFWTTSPNHGNGEGLGMRFFKVRFPNTGGYPSYNTDVNLPVSISVSYNSSLNAIEYYVNSEKVATVSRVSNADSYGFSLGAYLSTSDDGASKWYSLRYYNRTLKQEEIVKNFKHDKRRYKF